MKTVYMKIDHDIHIRSPFFLFKYNHIGIRLQIAGLFDLFVHERYLVFS